MVIRPSRESTQGWTRSWKAERAISHYLLNEHGWALNAFWLPEDRGEGVCDLKARAFELLVGSSPESAEARWNQMGD
jgi:hypothetical protein